MLYTDQSAFLGGSQGGGQAYFVGGGGGGGGATPLDTPLWVAFL